MDSVLELRDDHLFLQLSGEFDLPRLCQVIVEVGKRCRQLDCRRVLADARAHVGGIDVIDLHQIGELISREIPRAITVAVVVNEARLAMDEYLETVAVNRGVLIRVFTDMDEARLWLNNPRAVSGSH